jgi:hypothetical protein
VSELGNLIIREAVMAVSNPTGLWMTIRTRFMLLEGIFLLDTLSSPAAAPIEQSSQVAETSQLEGV